MMKDNIYYWLISCPNATSEKVLFPSSMAKCLGQSDGKVLFKSVPS